MARGEWRFLVLCLGWLLCWCCCWLLLQGYTLVHPPSLIVVLDVRVELF
jgi:hypothetical protein